MKNKELKNIAKKIAKAELIIQANEDPKAVKRAQQEIMELSGQVTNLDEMVIIDEMVQDILGSIT